MNNESEEKRLKKINLTTASATAAATAATAAAAQGSRPQSPSLDKQIAQTHPSTSFKSHDSPDEEDKIRPQTNPREFGPQSKLGVSRLSLFAKCPQKKATLAPRLSSSSSVSASPPYPNGLLSPDSLRPMTRGFVVQDMTPHHHDTANAIYTSTASECDTTATTFGGDLLAPSLNQSPSISSRLARTASAIPLRFHRNRDRNDTTTRWDRSKHSFRLKCFLYLTCLSVPANVYIFYCFKHPPLPVCSLQTSRLESFELNNGSSRAPNGSLVLSPTSISYFSSSAPLHINESNSTDLFVVAHSDKSLVSDPLCRTPETWEVLSLFDIHPNQSQNDGLGTTAEAFGDPNASFVCYDDIASADRKLGNYRFWIEGVSLGIIGIVGLIGKYTHIVDSLRNAPKEKKANELL